MAAKSGRPTLYKPEYAKQAEKLAFLGAIDLDLANFFQVSLSTIRYWMVMRPEFAKAVKVGKESADDRVERALYHRAVGYDYEAEKVVPVAGGEPLTITYREHVPPDTVACFYWLKNRRGDRWRDRPRDGDENGKLTIVVKGGPPE